MKPVSAADLLHLDKHLETEVLQCYPIPEQVIYQAAKCDYSETPIHHQQIPSPSECGERIVEMLLSNERGHYGCYSSDTQVLTENGWVYWPDVTEETVLAAYDTKTFEIKYENPSAVQKWDYKGKMYHLRIYYNVDTVPAAELLVSPDHRIIFADDDNTNYKVITAEEFYSLNKTSHRVIIPHPDPTKSYGIHKRSIDEKWVDYEGTIHCATVSTGALIVRRNNSDEIVCGNCLEHPQITFSVSGYVHNVMVQARTHRVGVSFDCLAPESLITVDEGDGNITISDLFEMYEANDELPLVRNLNEDTGHFSYAKIAKVFKNDLRDLYQVVLEDGRVLKCSMDHRIFTENGWKRLHELNPNDEVVCDGVVQTIVPIKSIEYLRTDVTYDIEVDGKYHNFVCDGIVVHNCQSQRYTGKRVIKVANNELPVDEVFYVRPPGYYTNRQGKKYTWTQEHYEDELEWIHQGCVRYAEKYEQGMCEEHIRDYLAQAIRQNFVVSFNLRSILHMMDLRAKRDAQLEIQAMMEQLAPHLEKWAPNVWNYYEEKRLYKARLSP